MSITPRRYPKLSDDENDAVNRVNNIPSWIAMDVGSTVFLMAFCTILGCLGGAVIVLLSK